MLIRTLAATGTVAILAFGAAHAPAAYAKTNDARIVCDGGSLTGDFQPGLSALNGTIAIDGGGDLTGCHGGDVESGKFTLTGSGSGSCLSGWKGSGELKVTWHQRDGRKETSTLSWHGEAGTKPDTFNGTVTSGLDSGGNGHLEASTRDVTFDDAVKCAAAVVGLPGYNKCDAKITFAALYPPPAKQ